MQIKELIKAVKTADFRSPQEVTQLVESAGRRTPDELSALLGSIVEANGGNSGPVPALRVEIFKVLAERALARELFGPLARAMVHADLVLLAALTELLPKVNSLEAHDVLCESLGCSRPEVREAAAKVLFQVASQQSLNALLKLVPKEDYHGRIEAVDVMAQKAQHRAMPLLAAVLKYGEPREQARALKWLGDPQIVSKDKAGAIALLKIQLDNAHERVAAQALQAFAAIVDENEFFESAGHLVHSPRQYVALAFVGALKNFPSVRGMGLLMQLMKTGNAAVKTAVVDALHGIGTPDCLSVLVEGVSAKDLNVRTKVTEVMKDLHRTGKVDLARSIVWLLRSRDVNVRRVAVELAREIKDGNELLPKLLKFLRDEDWWVRERVMDALVQMSGQRLTEHVIQFLDDPSDVVRRFAIGALRRLKDPRCVGLLVKLAREDTDWWVQEEAILTLGELEDQRVVPYLVQVMKTNPEVVIPSIIALGKLKAKETIPEIGPMLINAPANVKVAGIRFLIEHGTPADARYLHGMEHDPSPELRKVLDEAHRRWNVEVQPDERVMAALTGLDRLLADMEKVKGDDLMLAANRVPHVKKTGGLVPLGDQPIPADELAAMLYGIIPAEHRGRLEQLEEIDFSHFVKSHGLRFRVNVFRQLSGFGAVFRIVRNRIPKMENLGLPATVETFGDLPNGLVLVGGPTGSGKSTTLAALIDYINEKHSAHIVTIEDPIEVIHENKRCLINQRENGTHTASFEHALRSTLRQDPDVILVGELRDLETIQFAVMAAETGHLVFGTVHTVSADASVDRILNAFPPGRRPQMRSMLSETLRAVVCQHLLPRVDLPGQRVLAVEVMLNNDAIANLIRKDKCYQIASVVATHREEGMQSMDTALATLVRNKIVDESQAYMRAHDKKMFEAQITGEDPAAQAQAVKNAQVAAASAKVLQQQSSGAAGAAGATNVSRIPASGAGTAGGATMTPAQQAPRKGG
jgi:twitching motility protein PilT